MTPAQHRKYLAEWGNARRWLRDHGYSPKAADARRHAIHILAIGHDKSSWDLTNREFDAVLAKFLALSRGDDLNAQLEIIEQAERRAAATVRRIHVLMMHLQLKPGLESSYVRGISRNIFGQDQYDRLNDAQLAQLVGVILRRLRTLHPPESIKEFQAAAVEHAAKIEAIIERPGDPF